MAGEGGGLLDRLLEEAMQRGAAAAQTADVPVNASTTDADGTHTIEGVPLSQLGKAFKAKFGIGSEDGSDGAEGDGQAGDGQPAGPRRPARPAAAGKPGGLRDLFPAAKPASKASGS